MEKVKITLQQAGLAHAALVALTKENELPFETAWELEDLTESLVKPAARFEKTKNELILKYGTQKEGEFDPKTGQPLFAITDLEGFNKEYLKMANTQITLEVNPIKFVDLKKIEGLKLTGENLKALRTHFIVREPSADNGIKDPVDKKSKSS